MYFCKKVLTFLENANRSFEIFNNITIIIQFVELLWSSSVKRLGYGYRIMLTNLIRILSRVLVLVRKCGVKKKEN